MCQLVEKSSRSHSGYKIVAEWGDGDFYSPAIGIKYINNERITLPSFQYRISEYFVDDILMIGSPAYETNMVGRTAVFLTEDKANVGLYDFDFKVKGNFTLKVVPAIVYDNVMLGYYGGRCPDSQYSVAAGKRIYFPDLDPEVNNALERS